MLYITARPGDRLNLGREGENLARTIRFDISQWQALYGEGDVSLLHQRAGDANPYPCAITVDGAIVEWAITNADTAKPSQYGKYELQYRFGDGLSKACTGETCVFDALGEPAEAPPEPQQNWVDKVLDAANRAEDAAERAEEVAGGITDHENLTNRDAADQHPIGAITGLTEALEGKQPAGDYLLDTELPAAINDALAQAKASGEFDGKDGADGLPGSDGEDGYSPTVSVSTISGGHRVTIKDKTGTKTFDVMDGASGATGPSGEDGSNGVSPTVTVTKIEGGHKITITDVNGSTSFDVMDGTGGSGGAGEDGVTFYPSVSADGVISWTNDGGLTDPDPVNITGPAGPQGERGPQGIQGETGPQGDTGATGPQGPKGDTGATGPAGKDGEDGQPGSDGTPGADGVGIQSVVQTTTSTEDSGENIITVTKTDGTTSTFSVRNGSKGSSGGGGGGESVQSDWDVSDATDPAYVKNRTHYKTVTMSDTLITTGLPQDVGFETMPGERNSTVYKVSATVLTADNCPNGISFVGLPEFGIQDGSLTDEELATKLDTDGNGVIASRGIYPIIVVVNTPTESWPAPEPGLYVRAVEGFWLYQSITANGATIFGATTYTPLSEAYIPGQLIQPGEGTGSEVFNGLSASAATGLSSHAEGSFVTAEGECSHAEGSYAFAKGRCSHAEGNSTAARADYSHAEGRGTEASGENSHAQGYETEASNYASHAQGKYNKAMTAGGSSNNTTGDAMVIGNGTGPSALSNALRVTFAGETYGLSAFNSSGADYAEYFEWADLNPNDEDRVGYFVTMNGRYIRFANPGDYILGIVSGQPCIIGNSDEDWLGRWEHDEFGRFIREEVETPVTEWREVEVPVTDENGNQIFNLTKTEMQEVETGEFIKGWRYKANPDYDPSQQYVERKNRQEWDCVGMMGVLAVRDDGTCEVNGFCMVSDGGIATKADGFVPGVTYRVIERVSEGVVKVVFR